MPRLSDDCEERREQVDTLIGNIGVMYVQIVQARLRIRQAAERWPATYDLLAPVLVFFERWELYVLRMKEYLAQEQEKGKRNGWKE